MSLYYEDEYVQLHHGDCRAIRGWLSADVLVTDPPYGVAFQSSRTTGTKQHAKIAGDESTDLRDVALELWGDRPALVFGTWRAPRPQNVRQRLLWVKGDDPGLGDLSFPWGYGDEEAYVMGKGWHGPRRTNVYRMPKIASANNPGHPTPKPVALMEALIEYAPTGVIADPFAGSGATLIAARNLGRKAIGVELEEKYCELIVKRLSQQAFDFSALEAGA
ncbi:DNA methyltransferase [Microbacterium sp.]|uniref:DNA-methyltransferase n=1 Tax=Microbacterium sp. TaxID=51671 RepID=UPI003242D5A5